LELIFWLAVLYVWQCVIDVPEDAVLFRRSLRRVEVRFGGGRQLLPLWPSSFYAVGRWMPAVLANTQTSFTSEECGNGHVRASVNLLEESRERTALVRSLSTKRLRCRLRYARDMTRVAGVCCDSYLLLLFAATPVLIVASHEDIVLWYALPAALVLHMASVGALIRSQLLLGRRLSGDPWQTLLMAGLFPPALLRSAQELESQVLRGFHPLALAGVLLEREQFLAFAQQRLASLQWKKGGWVAVTRDASSMFRIEAAALGRIASEKGVSAIELMAPRQHRDPGAARYCPVCLSDYVARGRTCSDCGVLTRKYVEKHRFSHRKSWRSVREALEPFTSQPGKAQTDASFRTSRAG
jgi:hypothetical protein